MALTDHLPINESIGVFVGISGFDWLADGQAEPLRAAIAAVTIGVIIGIARRLMRKKQD